MPMRYAKQKLAAMLLGIVGMSFFLSFLIEVDLGTDPASFMNLSVSRSLGLSFGLWQAVMQCLLLALVILFHRDLIGPGTLCNMFLIGFLCDFWRWLWAKLIPSRVFEEWQTRIPVFIVAISLFILSCAIYMNADMGLAPYDGAPIIAHERLFPKLSFTWVRVAYDFLAILIGVLCGGRPNIGHFCMAVGLGPAITFVSRYVR